MCTRYPQTTKLAAKQNERYQCTKFIARNSSSHVVHGWFEQKSDEYTKKKDGEQEKSVLQIDINFDSVAHLFVFESRHIQRFSRSIAWLHGIFCPSYFQKDDNGNWNCANFFSSAKYSRSHSIIYHAPLFFFYRFTVSSQRANGNANQPFIIMLLRWLEYLNFNEIMTSGLDGCERMYPVTEWSLGMCVCVFVCMARCGVRCGCGRMSEWC